MRCERCGQREASIHIQKNINGRVSEQYLCRQCAEETGDLNLVFDSGFPMQNLLASFLQQWPGLSEGTQQPATDPRCPECGTAYSQFAQSSLLGCPQCYENLSPQLDPVIQRIQGNVQHVGKIPQRAGGLARVRRELSQLKDDQQQAIRAEDYEKAAQLRDRIKELEEKLAGGEGRAVE